MGPTRVALSTWAAVKRRFPSARNDGIMGDAAHQQRASDHNLGRALDVGGSQAVMSGVIDMMEGHLYVKYLLWQGWIWHRPWQKQGRLYVRGPGVWDWHGDKDHQHHVHISFRSFASGLEFREGVRG